MIDCILQNKCKPVSSKLSDLPTTNKHIRASNNAVGFNQFFEKFLEEGNIVPCNSLVASQTCSTDVPIKLTNATNCEDLYSECSTAEENSCKAG
uniref:Uncharacterized protein n=1 Tax=Meloidogyne floridensis TaxID=298350 RepID=A0A915NG78_9BILA